jgi:hypothetical protein
MPLGEFVFVDETAEKVSAVHASQRRRKVSSSRGDGGSRLWRLAVERAADSTPLAE